MYLKVNLGPFKWLSRSTWGRNRPHDSPSVKSANFYLPGCLYNNLSKSLASESNFPEEGGENRENHTAHPQLPASIGPRIRAMCKISSGSSWEEPHFCTLPFVSSGGMPWRSVFSYPKFCTPQMGLNTKKKDKAGPELISFFSRSHLPSLFFISFPKQPYIKWNCLVGRVWKQNCHSKAFLCFLK